MTDSSASWLSLSVDGSSRLASCNTLSEAQKAAVTGLAGAVSMVQAPPSSGSARLIAHAVLHRVPPGSCALVCCTSQHGVDAVLRELEAAGLATSGLSAAAALLGLRSLCTRPY